MRKFLLFIGGAFDIAFITFLIIKILDYIFFHFSELYMLGYSTVLALWCISCTLGGIRKSLDAYEELRGKK